MPNNSLFLVDTYDTLEGVRKATVVGRELRERGHRLLGVRLDSGDLGQLSVGARRILDEAGFEDAVIVASNDLDERAIDQLLQSGAEISVWGVGTKLATCFDQPALGGVYKLAAIRPGAADRWRPVIKLSEQPIKVSNPLAQQVRRAVRDGQLAGDVIYADGEPPPEKGLLSDGSLLELADLESHDLLTPALRAGERVLVRGSLADARSRCLAQLQQLPAEVLCDDGRPYPVGLEPSLHRLKQRLMEEAGD